MPWNTPRGDTDMSAKHATLVLCCGSTACCNPRHEPRSSTSAKPVNAHICESSSHHCCQICCLLCRPRKMDSTSKRLHTTAGCSRQKYGPEHLLQSDSNNRHSPRYELPNSLESRSPHPSITSLQGHMVSNKQPAAACQHIHQMNNMHRHVHNGSTDCGRQV